MRRRGGMKELSDLVARIYPSRSPEDRAMLLAQAHWARAMPPSVVRNAMPVRLQHGVLTIHTATAAWANTLQFESERLLQQLKAKVPHARLRRLDVRVGRVPQMPPHLTPQTEVFAVTPAELLPEDIAQALAHIQDDDVREAVAKAAATGLGRARDEK